VLSEFLLSTKPGVYLRRLQELGVGSSRRTYAIDDKLVIKIAVSGQHHRIKNLKPGIAQNMIEATVSADPLSKGLVARVVAVGPGHRWLMVERCPLSWDEDDELWKPEFEGAEILDEERLDKLLEKHRIAETGEFGVNGAGNLVIIDYGFTPSIGNRYYGCDLRSSYWSSV
jgi:hypothetical protein